MFILLLAGSARSDGTLPFHLLTVFLDSRMRDDKVVHDGYKAAAIPRYIFLLGMQQSTIVFRDNRREHLLALVTDPETVIYIAVMQLLVLCRDDARLLRAPIAASGKT